MSNTYCQEGYCETLDSESCNLAISDKVIIGGYLLLLMAITAFVLYQVSNGVYIDPESLM